MRFCCPKVLTFGSSAELGFRYLVTQAIKPKNQNDTEQVHDGMSHEVANLGRFREQSCSRSCLYQSGLAWRPSFKEPCSGPHALAQMRIMTIPTPSLGATRWTRFISLLPSSLLSLQVHDYCHFTNAPPTIRKVLCTLLLVPSRIWIALTEPLFFWALAWTNLWYPEPTLDSIGWRKRS